jgi:hypothetical protein
MDNKQYKNPAIGWVRMGKSRDGRFFFTVSIEDKASGYSGRAILRMDNESIAAVKSNSALVNKQVVGLLVKSEDRPDFKAGAARKPAFVPKAAVKQDTTSTNATTNNSPDAGDIEF